MSIIQTNNLNTDLGNSAYTIHKKHKNTLCGSIELQVEYPLTTVTGIVTFNLDIRSVHYLLNHFRSIIKPLNAKLNPICYLLALLGAHHFLHFSRIRVKQYFVQHVAQFCNFLLNVCIKEVG